MGNSRFEFLENTYYHVYNRGNQKQMIFRDDEDYDRFYKYIIKELKDFINIKIVSYCFLPNHFHLVINNLKSGFDLSNFMRKVQGSYTMYYKFKYRDSGLIQKGAFFEGRFKSKIINDKDYLLQCLAYVNFNPIKHKIVKNIDDYKWSSYHQIDKKKIEEFKDLLIDELEY